MNDVSEEHTVKFVRIKNGDDIIAEVVEVGEDGQIDYMIINPLKVVYMPSQQGTSFLQVAFMPWVFSRICEEQEFLIHAEDVITMGNVTEKMAEYYWNNIDHFTSKGQEELFEDVEEEPAEEEATLETLLEALKSARRTYH